MLGSTGSSSSGTYSHRSEGACTMYMELLMVVSASQEVTGPACRTGTMDVWLASQYILSF